MRNARKRGHPADQIGRGHDPHYGEVRGAVLVLGGRIGLQQFRGGGQVQRRAIQQERPTSQTRQGFRSIRYQIVENPVRHLSGRLFVQALARQAVGASVAGKGSFHQPLVAGQQCLRPSRRHLLHCGAQRGFAVQTLAHHHPRRQFDRVHATLGALTGCLPQLKEKFRRRRSTEDRQYLSRRWPVNYRRRNSEYTQ